MDHEIQMHLKWVRLYEAIGHAGIVCNRCGISRPTLRKWASRYEQYGLDGLKSASRRPYRSPSRKVDQEKAGWILKIRKEYNLGARRIQNELIRLYDFSISLSTIQKVLNKHDVGPLRRPPRKKHLRRFAKKIPGERVQIDTCQISPGLFQYTAVDDCTRYQVLELYPCRTANNTLDFLEKMVEETPFPIQRVQTDRGREFFAYKVQQWLMDNCIKFRPVRPGSPHLNGKVERAQRTDLEEFYATVDLCDEHLRDLLAEWQNHYNWNRIHGAIGKSPMDRYFELQHKTPFWDEVVENYDRSKERFREQCYDLDVRLSLLK